MIETIKFMCSELVRGYMAVNIIILNCLHCGNQWLQRFPDRPKPRYCPKCRNLNYDKPRQKAHHTKTRKQNVEVKKCTIEKKDLKKF